VITKRYNFFVQHKSCLFILKPNLICVVPCHNICQFELILIKYVNHCKIILSRNKKKNFDLFVIIIEFLKKYFGVLLNQSNITNKTCIIL